MIQSTSTAPPEVSAGKLVFQVASGYMASAALQVAMRLDIAARLSNGPRPVADLAREAGVQTDGLYRVLRALASLGIFAESSPRTFALTLAAELLRKGPGALGDGIEFITDPLHFETYAEALHSVQTGQPAGEKVVGMPLFEYLAKTPEWSTSFNNAMTAFSANVMPAVLKAYDFSGIGTLVDVAGGHGHVLTSVLREYPQMRGVLFDLEHVIAGSGPVLTASGVQSRVRAEPGDFFKAVPAGGDAYIMKHIIHDWDDERAAAILSNIRKALNGKPQGRVILLEAVLAAGNAADFAKLLDLEMMLFPGGRERTAEEFGALFDRAGFTLTTVVPTESMLSIVEARTR
jgi:O-methyltransferase domain/Dimerisation domain